MADALSDENPLVWHVLERVWLSDGSIKWGQLPEGPPEDDDKDTPNNF